MIYYHNAPRYWVRAMDFAPYFWNERDGEQISTQVKTLSLVTEGDANAVVAALNSSLFYWWFLLLSDCRHLNLREIESFPLGLGQIQEDTKRQLVHLTAGLMESLKRHSQRKEARYQATGKVVYDEFDQKPSKPILDKIDRVLAEHYGFTEEELDFIINYGIKYRMGRMPSKILPSEEERMAFPQQTPREFKRDNITALSPDQIGVYGLFRVNQWVYVGRGDIRQRLLDHLNGDNPCITRNAPTHWLMK